MNIEQHSLADLPNLPSNIVAFPDEGEVPQEDDRLGRILKEALDHLDASFILVGSKHCGITRDGYPIPTGFAMALDAEVGLTPSTLSGVLAHLSRSLLAGTDDALAGLLGKA